MLPPDILCTGVVVSSENTVLRAETRGPDKTARSWVGDLYKKNNNIQLTVLRWVFKHAQQEVQKPMQKLYISQSDLGKKKWRV